MVHKSCRDLFQTPDQFRSNHAPEPEDMVVDDFDNDVMPYDNKVYVSDLL